MANMSYCRFENTSRDMQDCLHAIEYSETKELSNYEQRGLEDFLNLAKEIVSIESKIMDKLESYEK